jgi:hypothetical protein
VIFGGLCLAVTALAAPPKPDERFGCADPAEERLDGPPCPARALRRHSISGKRRLGPMRRRNLDEDRPLIGGADGPADRASRFILDRRLAFFFEDPGSVLKGRIKICQRNASENHTLSKLMNAPNFQFPN